MSEDLTIMSITLGEAETAENLSDSQRHAMAERLHAIGFELLDDPRSQLVEQIRIAVLAWVRMDSMRPKLSDYLSCRLHREYSSLSKLFSEVRGITIERFAIHHRVEYAKELHSGKEKLYRALIISNLVAIHEKTGIGTLSAYCGAVSAGAGAGAGIVYLCGDGYQAAIHTVVNALAIVSGIVCDGAKASCAAKIASSVDAALLGYNMYKCHQEFKGGDGIVMKDIETTIKGIGRLGKDGMKETNEEIIRLMIE